MVNEMSIKKLLSKKTVFFAALLTLSNSALVMSQETNHPKYWDTQSITNQVSRAKTYTAALVGSIITVMTPTLLVFRRRLTQSRKWFSVQVAT